MSVHLPLFRNYFFTVHPLLMLWAGSSCRRDSPHVLHPLLEAAAVRAAIGKIGWHTFRHTYSTMLRAAGADIKVQQELLRHSTIQSTMNIYTQAVSEQKRAANSSAVAILFSECVSNN